MKKWTILLLALLCSTAGAAAQDFSVVNPRCEYRDEPLGINTLTPRFSWQISARDRGFLQSAYELIVGDDRAAVAAGRGNLWRVKAKGAESLHIPYAGKALESGKESIIGACASGTLRAKSRPGCRSTASRRG